jgi:hypothetical protein
MPTKTTKTLAEIATSNPIGRALLTQLPGLVEQITEYRVETFNRCAEKFAVAERPGYWERPYGGMTWSEREMVNAMCSEAWEIGDSKGEYVNGHHAYLTSSTINPEKLQRVVSEQAEATALAWFLKIASKIGECVDATLERSGAASYVMNCTLASGRAVRIEQQVVHAISTHGKRYVQFPARLYVEGKFYSEAAYKRTFVA